MKSIEVSDKIEKVKELAESEKIEENPSRTYNLCYIIQLSLIGSIGGFLLGYDTGVIAGAQVYFD